MLLEPCRVGQRAGERGHMGLESQVGPGWLTVSSCPVKAPGHRSQSRGVTLSGEISLKLPLAPVLRWVKSGAAERLLPGSRREGGQGGHLQKLAGREQPDPG